MFLHRLARACLAVPSTDGSSTLESYPPRRNSYKHQFPENILSLIWMDFALSRFPRENDLVKELRMKLVIIGKCQKC